MSRLTAVAVATSLVALGFTATSFAAGSGAKGTTFAGQCQFTGTSTFSSTVTLVPSPARDDVTASGSCSGTLTTRSGRTTQLSNEPVQYRASEFGRAESCNSNPNAAGDGKLVFQQGTVRFTVVENRVGGQAALAYNGRDGGSATGVASVNSPDPAGLLAQCATSGITSAPVQIVFQSTPSISG
jgi:hypothetical protein